MFRVSLGEKSPIDVSQLTSFPWPSKVSDRLKASGIASPALAFLLIADLLLASRLLLAALFAVAGVAKLLDRASARQAVGGFGVPPPLVVPVATALPVAELMTALALVDAITARAGAVGASLLLAAFLAGIAVTLARGSRPDCRCFGQLRSARVGRQTLVRNGVFLAVAVVVAVAGPGTGLAALTSRVSAVDWLSILVAGILAVAFVVEGSQLLDRWRGRSRAR